MREALVKYLILIYSNPESRAAWNGFTPAERAEGMRGHFALNKELTESGEMIVSEPLADPAEAKRILVRDGKTIATDGPFAEVKEHLAGFYLIDCESMERAIERAGQLPEAELGLVEVRPVADLSGYDVG